MRIPAKTDIAIAIASALVCCFFSAGLTTSIIQKGLGSSDAAGWIQAIGATLGLGIAIWIPYDQKNQATKDDIASRREGALRVCIALYDELTLILESLSNKMAMEIIDGSPTEPFPYELPLGPNPHPIFDAYIERLVEIDDKETRHKIISAYDSGDALRELIRLNTRLMHELKDLQRASIRDARVLGTTPYGKEERSYKTQLIDLRQQLRTAAVAAKSDVGSAIQLLEMQISLYASGN